VVLPGSELAGGVEVGPWCVVEPGVELGEGVKLGPHVHLSGRTIIGAGTRIGTGSALGGEPADKDYAGERSRVLIGENCRIFEHCTVHRASGDESATVLEDGVMMMAGSHVGHNSIIRTGATLVNHSAVAGHAEVGEGAILVASSAVHQFGKVGRMTMVGGGSMVTKDAPPFSIVAGSYPIRWRTPNTIGLRRAGFSPEERDALRRALHTLFTSGDSPTETANSCTESEFPSVRELANFVLTSKRGVCAGPERTS
jgi:UDP-N-acetylglucosamine acyltransferase